MYVLHMGECTYTAMAATQLRKETAKCCESTHTHLDTARTIELSNMIEILAGVFSLRKTHGNRLYCIGRDPIHAKWEVRPVS